jgi:hypothetical protein
MGHEEIHVAVPIEVDGVYTHAGLGLALLVDRTATQNRLVLEGAVPLVDPHLVGILVVGDIEIGPAITVEVVGDRAQGVAVLLTETRAAGSILVGTVAEVA